MCPVAIKLLFVIFTSLAVSAILLALYLLLISPDNKKMFKDLLLAIPTLGNAYKKKALEVNGDEFIQLVGYAHSDGTYHWFEVKRIV